MQITLKLFASLADRLPPGSHRNQAPIEIDESSTVQAVIERHNIANNDAHLVLVNGVYIAPEDRSQRELIAGDAVAIWPPVAGG
ncbi:MoaD/ThiS family protein [Gammaproteobacteria bacterium]|nr:MoaD/ThiS family protein [Gammaproteobacteria bacterium]